MLLLLPHDIIKIIGFNLNIKDLTNFANSCSVIYDVISKSDFGQSYHDLLNITKQHGYDSYGAFIEMVLGDNWLHSYKILYSCTNIPCHISVTWRLSNKHVKLHLYSSDTIETFIKRTHYLITKYIQKMSGTTISNTSVYASDRPFDIFFSCI
jgi:hypothetical protein